MVNGFRYYRALESVSIASALSTALTIYPCEIRDYQRWQYKLQLPTARKKGWRSATADSSPHAVTCQHCDTHYFSRPRTRNLPTTKIIRWLISQNRKNTNSLTSTWQRVVNDISGVSRWTGTGEATWIVAAGSNRTTTGVVHCALINIYSIITAKKIH